MTIFIKALGGIKASGLILATTVGGILMATQIVTAPPAYACNGLTDPVTGVCWPSTMAGGGISGTGGVCMPGRLGLCMAGLQNSQIPGATLPKNTGVGQSQSWP